MLNITNRQGNANQKPNEVPPHTHYGGYYQKKGKITQVIEDAEKLEFLCTIDGSAKRFCYERQYGGSSQN